MNDATSRSAPPPAVPGPTPTRPRRAARRLAAVSLLWLGSISALHYWRNGDPATRRVVRMGHMPVLSNLSCPLLDKASEDADVRFVALKFSSFAELGEAFRNGDIEAAFIIAPLPVVLRSQGLGLRIVYIGNRHESTLVARRELGLGPGQAARLAGRTVAVPLRFSGHTLALRRLLSRHGGDPSAVRVVEMPPPDMPSALQNGSLDAYFVGEPFAARSVQAGFATVVERVEDGWPGFLCNVMIVHETFLQRDPALARALIQGAVRASLWSREHKREAIAVASRAWGQPVELLAYALDTPPDRVVFDQSTPRVNEVRELVDEMVQAGLLEASRAPAASDLVDDRLAASASAEGLTADIRSVLEIR